MNPDIFIDTAYRSLNHHGEHICGDGFILRKLSYGSRTVAVLSDGMGHGVRANILSTFTSTMLMNFISAYSDITEMTNMILRMLPVSSVNNVSYSTFTIADINHRTGEVIIIQHDNPPAILLRDGAHLQLEWEESVTVREGMKVPVKLRTARFISKENDRIIMVSDGVTQSGQKTGLYKFGWGEEALTQFASFLVSVNPGITSSDIASQVVSRANINDDKNPADDTSCAVLSFRTPKRMMLISCPPSLSEDNPKLLEKVSGFEGVKVVCGHPVATILAKGMGLKLEHKDNGNDPLDAPAYHLNGFELVTEGMIVPNRVLDLLEYETGEIRSNDVAGRLTKMLLRHDVIEFVIGLRRNADSAGNLPDEFVLRRNILRQIASLLETKWGKQVNKTYI